MSRITKRYIDSISPPESHYQIHWDDELKGFGVRIMDSGTTTFIVNYRTKNGKQRRLSIGRYGSITPAQARRRAIQILGEVANNGDPLEDLKYSRKATTFQALVKEYIVRHASRKKSGKEDIRIITKDLLKPWGTTHAKDISRRDVISLINSINERGAPIAANRTLALIRKIFNFGIEQAILESNPCVLVKPPGKENQRDRTLSPQEIHSFWHSLPGTDTTESIQTILKLILATAQRPGEVASAEWDEFDLTTNWWTIPAEKSKNGLAHRVPIDAFIKGLIGENSRKSKFIFPSPTNPDNHITINALSHAIRRNQSVLDIDHFTPHDLRRTAASQLASMGISRLVISRILNHKDNGITAVYDRHGYDNEKKRAIKAWVVKLTRIIEGSKGDIIELGNRI